MYQVVGLQALAEAQHDDKRTSQNLTADAAGLPDATELTLAIGRSGQSPSMGCTPLRCVPESCEVVPFGKVGTAAEARLVPAEDEAPGAKAALSASDRRLLTVERSVYRRARLARACRIAYCAKSVSSTLQAHSHLTTSMSPRGYPSGSTSGVDGVALCCAPISEPWTGQSRR